MEILVFGSEELSESLRRKEQAQNAILPYRRWVKFVVVDVHKDSVKRRGRAGRKRGQSSSSSEELWVCCALSAGDEPFVK